MLRHLALFTATLCLFACDAKPDSKAVATAAAAAPLAAKAAEHKMPAPTSAATKEQTPTASDDATMAALEAEARQCAASFGKRLMSRLTAAMTEGGPLAAISACSLDAPKISQDAGQGPTYEGWKVGRTALRNRNQSNAPDDWEKTVLTHFEARIAAGEDPGSIDAHEIIELDGQRTFRYMKAIPTGPQCLVCHGAQLDPSLGAEIAKLYPKDEATGFAVGELRGAFSVSKRLDPPVETP